MRILKFGGKSLATKEKMQNVCKYIKKIYKNDQKIIVVVSAIGKTTDELIEKANHYSITKTPARELDVLLSTGETVSSALFASMLCSMNVPAKSFQGFQINLETFGSHQNSRIAYLNKKPLLEAMENGEVAVVAGFQGINKIGEITTLGRGGSDTTAVAIASVFGQNVEIYSDFDGVFCGDPRLFNFKKFKKLNYDAMISMAKSGAKVLDLRATKIAKNFDCNIISKSSAEPTKKGTIISSIESDFLSISAIDDLSRISIDFSDKNKIDFILKIVTKEIKQLNFYNLTVQDENINFYVEKKNKGIVLSILSKKLNLLKK